MLRRFSIAEQKSLNGSNKRSAQVMRHHGHVIRQTSSGLHLTSRCIGEVVGYTSHIFFTSLHRLSQGRLVNMPIMCIIISGHPQILEWKRNFQLKVLG